MALQKLFRMLAFSMALSCIAPGVLMVAGVADRGLMLLELLPSIVVGLASAWFAARRPSTLARWVLDERRLP